MKEFNHKKADGSVEVTAEMREKNGTVLEMEEGTPLDETMIARMQELVGQLGRREKKGVMFILVTDADAGEEKGKVQANGIFFTHLMSTAKAAALMIKTAHVDLTKLLTQLM